MGGKARYLVLAGLVSISVLASSSALPQPVSAAPTVSNLTFSTAMTADFQPAGEQGIYFGRDNPGVYVTFTYNEMPGGGGLSRIVRFGGSDYNFDDKPYPLLNCCPAGSGRYGFRIVRIDGDEGELPGGDYEVVIYLNGQQIQSGGFGIRGGQGEGKDELPGGNNDDDDDDDDD